MAKSTVRSWEFEQTRGSSLEIDTVSLTIGSGVTVPKMTPMALNSSNNMHFPYDPAGSNGLNKALYLSAFDIDTTAGATKHALIRKGGFHIDVINWPAATETFNEKAAVFAGTPISVNELDG